MIQRIICAILGHKKCQDSDNIVNVYGEDYRLCDRIYHCPRCKERVFNGIGLMYCELIDVAKATLKNMPKL